jgi:hypothetical protein
MSSLDGVEISAGFSPASPNAPVILWPIASGMKLPHGLLTADGLKRLICIVVLGVSGLPEAFK